MSRITRKTLSIFGLSGGSSNFGEFGSQAASAPVNTKDVATIQSLAAWANGWQDAVAIGQAPYLQDMNSLFYVHSYMEAYNLQEGVAEWDAGTTYYIGSVVKVLNSSYCEFYVSLANTNLNQTPPTRVTDAHWQFLYALKTGSGLILPGTPTNDAAPTGAVGEYVQSYAATVTLLSTDWGNITSIDLTAGDWDVSGVGWIDPIGASITGVYEPSIALSLFSGGTTSDQVFADNEVRGNYPTSGSNPYATTLSIPAWRVSISTSKTVYLKALISSSAGNIHATGRVSARRVR